MSFVDNSDDPASWRVAVLPNTKPAVAHEVGVPLVVNNTVATPYLIRPIDSGRFDYSAHPERFPNDIQPDPS